MEIRVFSSFPALPSGRAGRDKGRRRRHEGRHITVTAKPLRSALCRQEDAKRASGAHGALDPDPTAVQLGDGLGDAEAQAGAAHFSGARLIRPVEPVEDVRQSFGGDARPGVLNGDLRPDRLAIWRLGNRTTGGSPGLSDCRIA